MKSGNSHIWNTRGRVSGPYFFYFVPQALSAPMFSSAVSTSRPQCMRRAIEPHRVSLSLCILQTTPKSRLHNLPLTHHRAIYPGLDQFLDCVVQPLIQPLRKSHLFPAALDNSASLGDNSYLKFTERIAFQLTNALGGNAINICQIMQSSLGFVNPSPGNDIAVALV